MKKEMTNDMTVGSPAKLIIQFMIPMCLGNVFQQFYNIADSIIAGQFLGVNALAAIGSTGSLMFFVTGWLQGLTSGFAILVSQWFGAKDMKRMRHYVAMSIYLTIAFAVVMTIGFEFANEPILRLMNSPENLMADIKGYMAVIYGGLIVTAAYNALAAVLRALGDSKSPLYFLIISAIINVVLDIVFIVNFGMGVEGCGYATVIAQAVSALLCLIYIVVSDLYCKKISDPAAFGRRFSDFLSEHGTASGIGNSHGTAVFYYGDRNDHCAGSGQYLRSGIYGRIFSCRKTAEYYCDSIYCVWRHSCHICGSEPRSRENGSCT